jgi:hypothetical protein
MITSLISETEVQRKTFTALFLKDQLGLHDQLSGSLTLEHPSQIFLAQIEGTAWRWIGGNRSFTVSLELAPEPCIITSLQLKLRKPVNLVHVHDS